MFEENEISIASQGGTEITKRSLAQHLEKLPGEFLQNFQVICSRVRNIEENKIRVYWLHDLPEDPESSHLKEKSSRDRFHKLIFTSHWQYNQFINKLNIPINDKVVVIDTPVDSIDLVPKDKETIRLIYTSTPQRGLELLFPVFEKLCEKHKNIHLDVFSSFKIYGWDEADQKFEKLYQSLRNHPKITYHGFQPREVVVEHLQKAHIFAYPCVWQETSCRSLIEAMSAGLLCVHPNYAALPDTSGGLTFMYQHDHDPNKHANKFYHALNHAIEVVNNEDMQNYLKFVKMYADSRFGWHRITSQWHDILHSLYVAYENVDSRKLNPSTGDQGIFHYVVK